MIRRSPIFRNGEPRRNADERRRQAERRVAAGGSTEDDARLLAERMRSGDLTPERVEAAASLGHPAARMLAPVPLVGLPNPNDDWSLFADRFGRGFTLECVLLMIEIERAMLPMVRWYTHDAHNPDEELADARRCTDASHTNMEPGTCPRSRFLPREIAAWNAIYNGMRTALLSGRSAHRIESEIASEHHDLEDGLWGHWDLFIADWAVSQISDKGIEVFAREEASGLHGPRKFSETLALFHAWNNDEDDPPFKTRPAWIAQRLADLILSQPTIVRQ